MIDNTIPDVSIKNKEAFQALLEMDEKERTMKEKQGYYMAYIWSVILPPFGIYYFIKYIFFSNGTSDDFKAGFLCLLFTLVALLLSIWLMGYLYRQATSTIPSQGTDILKELITPANQKNLKDLLQ